MLNHMLVAVNAVLPSFLIIVLGLFIRKRGKLDDKSLGKNISRNIKACSF